jgi:hypothetical protein
MCYKGYRLQFTDCLLIRCLLKRQKWEKPAASRRDSHFRRFSFVLQKRNFEDLDERDVFVELPDFAD